MLQFVNWRSSCKFPRGVSRPSALLALFVGLAVLFAGAAIWAQVVTIPHPNPPPAFGYFGIGVQGISDLDEDGKGDLLISAVYADGMTTNSGVAYIYSGGTTTTLMRTLISPNTQENGDFYTLAVLPDITNDGKDEIAVGADFEDVGGNSWGRVYVFSGVDASTPTLTLLSPIPNTNFSFFGNPLSSVPDVNGDDIGDLMVAGSDQSLVFGNKSIYFFSGSDGALIHSVTGPSLESAGGFGASLSGLIDVNDDGRGDCIVGAFRETVSGEDDAGRAYVFSGSDGTLLRTHVSPFVDYSSQFGQQVLGCSDMNYDGVGDYIISAAFEGVNGSGTVYVYSGATGQIIKSLYSPSPALGGGFGIRLAAIPDMTGDGLPDLAIGAHGEPQGYPFSHGRIHLFRSDSWTLLQTLASPNPQIFAWFGISIAGVPDVNGDGLGELLAAVPSEYLPGAEATGQAYLYLAPPAPPTLTPSPPPSPTPNAAIRWEIYQ